MIDRLERLSPEERRRLALTLRQTRRPETAPPRQEIPRQGGPGPHPASFPQRRLWFLDRLMPGSAAYHIPMVVRLRGPLDPSALASALREVVRRHESLRTVFAEDSEGEPVQVVVPPGEVETVLPRVDLAGGAETEIPALVAEIASRPFDLAHGPLLRASLLRLADSDHVVVITLHHIVSDGWSVAVLTRELMTLYGAAAAGLPSPLPELPIQYGDFARWQRRRLSGELLESELGYWRARLSGLAPRLELPADRPRPPVRSSRGAELPQRLSGPLVSGLHDLARRRGVTPFMLLLAVFQALLARLAGVTDLAVGVPVSGRELPEVQGLVGFFVNSLVLRGDLRGDPPFTAFLERVREAALGAQAHQEIPFERLVENLQPERDLSYSPVFQVLFAFQNTPREDLAGAGLAVEPVALDWRAAPFDLTLSIEERGGALIAGWTYSTELFDRPTVLRTAERFRRLLEAVTADPERRISELPLFAAAETAQLLREWNDTRTSWPPHRSLHGLFEAQAARTPDAVAVVFEDERLVYRDLDRLSNRLAHRLRRLGVERGSLVGVAMERCPDLIVGLLGILKAGAAWVPVEPTDPDERLALVLADAAAPVLLTQERHRPRLSALHAGAVLCPAEWESGSPEPPDVHLEGEDLAYVLYTSGSTGRPKGAMNTHAAICNRLLWMQEAYPLTSEDRVLQKTPFTFDVSVWELFWPLLVGARMVLARPGAQRDPAALLEAMAQGVTTVHFVPSMLQAFLEEPGLERVNGLRRVIASGEALPGSLARRLFERLPRVELHNLYGPTEAAIDVTAWACAPEDGDSLPIGRPIANLEVHVFDAGMGLQPLGVPGELFLGGVGLARGYLGRPDLTAERFVPHPWVPGARLYRTGDLVRRRPDGAVEFLGRLDHQVKVRGVRIELGEVETALASHPAVRQAVATVHERDGDRWLAAYVVGEGLTDEALRGFLSRKLPEAMVPSFFVPLASLPVTSSGKIDRKALPAPDRGRTGTPGDAEPRGFVEEAVAAIWREVLKLDRVGVHDNFFDLGGHSLLANRVALRVRSLLQVDLPLQSLFEDPTVARLARRIEHEVRSGAAQVLPLVPVAGQNATAPLSFAQQRLWFLDQLEPGRADYHIPLAVRLAGGLDIPALERALSEIMRRHASLRTAFRTEAGEPLQVVSPPLGLILPRVDLSALDTGTETEASRLAAEALSRPFDLGRGPLFRLLLLRLAPEDHALVAILHHIVSDGWSTGIFVREMTALYGAFRQGLPSPLPELPLQYPDFAVGQRAWLDGPNLAGPLDWWRGQLAGMPPILELPFDHSRGARGRGRSEPVCLPADLTHSLATLGRRDGATLFMVLLAAFQTLLGRSARQADVAVGTPVANRGRLEIEGLIGLFVNTLVLRADLSDDPGFRGLLRRVREKALGAYLRQEVPFEKLVEELEPERELGRTPLFQVMFRLEEDTEEPLDLPGLALRPLAMDSGAVRFDLTLALFESTGGLAGSLDYDSSLFDPTTIQRMAGHLRVLLEGIAAEPERRLSLLPWLAEAERHELTLEWNDTAASTEDGRCLHELFEEQAARTPDAVAVVFEDEALTFADLDARADRLRRRLRALGIGPEVPVGLCVERSAEMVVGLLAVLKAGGAYLPLDPAFPEERLRFQMRDAGAGVLVLQDRLRRLLPGLAGDARAMVILDAAEEERGGRCHGGALPGNLVYVIYTSGSTGRPKGVPVEHRQLLGYLRGVIERLDLPAGASFATVSTLAADLGHTTLFPPLISGGCLHVLSRDRAGDAEAMAAYFETRVVDCLKIVPSHLAALQGSRPGSVLPRLRLVLGGEAADADEARRLAATAPGCRVFNHYGPTETTVGVATHPVGTESARPRGGTLPLGRPLPGVVIRLLDPWLGPVPVGVTGELCIGGPGVARGYPGHPGLTAERFVPDPSGREPGARLYRTGDLARLLPAGEIEFLGRADTQVKIRGFRVEPGEVEAALRAHPGVRDAALLARDGLLVAYAVPSGDGGEPLTLAAVRAGLGRSLPEPMLPAALVVLDALPLTPNGKLDRASLARITPEARAGASEYAPPRDPVEETLAALWSELLGVESPGIHDGFFDLGGHSLLITRLRSRVQAAFGVDLPLRDLFTRPTIAETAAAVRARQGSGAPAGMRLTAIPRARHSMRRADLDKAE